MGLPKTKRIGKKNYGLRQTTPKKSVGKVAVNRLHKKGTPARLVKSTDTQYGVYAGASQKPKKAKTTRKARSTKKQTHRDDFIW